MPDRSYYELCQNGGSLPGIAKTCNHGKLLRLNHR